MSLKILGGDLKGLELKAGPEILKTELRPTQVALKRKVFDAHQFFAGKTFIDLCAGTGSMGIEAWSRGAKSVYFIEKSSKVSKFLRQNIESAQRRYQKAIGLNGLGPSLHILEMSCETFIDKLENLYERYGQDIILFFDPPYQDLSLYRLIFKRLYQICPSGEFWTEVDSKSFDWKNDPLLGSDVIN